MKTSHFGILVGWLVVFLSSGARHLRSPCPTSTGSETSHLSWHSPGFLLSLSPFTAHLAAHPLLPLVPGVLPRRHSTGPCPRAAWHRCRRGMPSWDCGHRRATATARPLPRTGVHITLPIAPKSREKDHKTFDHEGITPATVPESNLPAAQAALPHF